MPHNLNARDTLAQMSPDMQVALLAFFYDSWSEIKRIGIDPAPECERLGVDREAFDETAALIRDHWNGAN